MSEFVRRSNASDSSHDVALAGERGRNPQPGARPGLLPPGVMAVFKEAKMPLPTTPPPTKGSGDFGFLAALTSDEYKTDKGYKALSATQQAEVDKEVTTLKKSASYENALAFEQKLMREAIADAAVLKASPTSPAAQNEVGKTLNDERTAALLKDNTAFAHQFLEASGGQLHTAVDAYVKLRPKGRITGALSLIGDTRFAETAEGQAVLLKSLVLERTGKVQIKDAGHNRFARVHYASDQVLIDDQHAGSPAAVAIGLVHEATHLVDRDEHLDAHPSIDDEVRAHTNELAVYRELNQSQGFFSVEDDRRANRPVGGSLWTDIRSRYLNLPEHRYSRGGERTGYEKVADLLAKSETNNHDFSLDGAELAASINRSNPQFRNNPNSYVGNDQAQFLVCGYSADGALGDARLLDLMIKDGVITKDAKGGLTVNSSAYQDMINSADPKIRDYGASRLAYSVVFAGGGANSVGVNVDEFRASLDMANRGKGNYGPAFEQMFNHYAGADGRLSHDEAKKMALDGALGTGSLNTTFKGKAEVVTGLVVKVPSMAGYDSNTMARTIAGNSGADGVDAQELQGWLPGQSIDQLNVLMHGYSADGVLSQVELEAMINEGVLKVGANGKLRADPAMVFEKAQSANPAVAARYQERLSNMLGTYGQDSEDTTSEYLANTYGVQVPERITTGDEFMRALTTLTGQPVKSDTDVAGIVASFTQFNQTDHSRLRENNVRYAVASGAVTYDPRTGAASVDSTAYA